MIGTMAGKLKAILGVAGIALLLAWNLSMIAILIIVVAATMGVL